MAAAAAFGSRGQPSAAQRSVHQGWRRRALPV